MADPFGDTRDPLVKSMERAAQERSRAIHKAAGILDAAYFVHARADVYRQRGWNKQIVEVLDGVADDLKGYAVSVRGD